MEKRNTWSQPTKSGSLKYFLLLMIIFMSKILIGISCDIVDQSILESDWRGTTGHIQLKVVGSDGSLRN